jgi:hypothetical protein
MGPGKASNKLLPRWLPIQIKHAGRRANVKNSKSHPAYINMKLSFISTMQNIVIHQKLVYPLLFLYAAMTCFDGFYLNLLLSGNSFLQVPQLESIIIRGGNEDWLGRMKCQGSHRVKVRPECVLGVPGFPVRLLSAFNLERTQKNPWCEEIEMKQKLPA